MRKTIHGVIALCSALLLSSVLSGLPAHAGGPSRATNRSRPNPEARWDEILVGTWYVPAPNLLAYLVTPEDEEPLPIFDQTLFQIASASNGEFSGQSSTVLKPADSIDDPPSSVTQFTMSGLITPDGQIRIDFTPTDPNDSPVVGLGTMELVAGQWRMTMQMASQSSLYVVHWAFMTKLLPGQSPEKSRDRPLEQWLANDPGNWLLGTRWAITDSAVFGSTGGRRPVPRRGVFEIDGYRKGYFWGSGGGPTPFTIIGSITPEGSLLLVLTADGEDPVYRTGVFRTDGDWRMLFRSYEGQPEEGAAALIGW